MDINAQENQLSQPFLDLSQQKLKSENEITLNKENTNRMLFIQNETHIVLDGLNYINFYDQEVDTNRSLLISSDPDIIIIIQNSNFQCSDFPINEIDELLIYNEESKFESLFQIQNAQIIQSINNTFRNCKEATQGSIFHITNSNFYDQGSIFESNSALEGGSFYIINSSLILNNTIVSNQMAQNGGFIYSLDLVNHTFYNLSVNYSTALQSGGLIYHISNFLRIPEEEGESDDDLVDWLDVSEINLSRRVLDELIPQNDKGEMVQGSNSIQQDGDEQNNQDTNTSTTIIDPFIQYFTQIAFLNGARISHARCVGYGGALFIDNQYMNVYLNGSVTVQHSQYNYKQDPSNYETGGGFLYTKLMNNFVMYDSQSLNSSQKYEVIPIQEFIETDFQNVGQFIQTEVNDKAKVKVHLWNNYFHGYEGEMITIRIRKNLFDFLDYVFTRYYPYGSLITLKGLGSQIFSNNNTFENHFSFAKGGIFQLYKAEEQTILFRDFNSRYKNVQAKHGGIIYCDFPCNPEFDNLTLNNVDVYNYGLILYNERGVHEFQEQMVFNNILIEDCYSRILTFVYVAEYYGIFNVTNLTIKNILFAWTEDLFTGQYNKGAYFQNVLYDGAEINFLLRMQMYNVQIFSVTALSNIQIRNLTIKNIRIENVSPLQYPLQSSYIKVRGDYQQQVTTLLLEDITIECNNYSVQFEELKLNRNGLKPTAERNVYAGQNQGISIEQFLSVVTKRINITNYYSRIPHPDLDYKFSGFQAISLANFTKYQDENSIYQNIMSINYGVYIIDRPLNYEEYDSQILLPESFSINNCTIQNVVAEYGGLLNVLNLNINVTIEHSNIINVSASKNGSIFHLAEEQLSRESKTQVQIFNSRLSNVEVQKNGGIYLKTINLERISIQNSSFQFISADQGALVFVEAFQGNVEIKNSTFNNFYSASNGRLIYSIASTFSFLMRDSFIDCNLFDLNNSEMSQAFNLRQLSIQQRSILQVSNSQLGVTLSNNSIKNCNSAFKGSFAQIINSKLIDSYSNYSSNSGTAAVISCFKCNMTIENSIFKDNQANEGGAILIENSGNIQLRNVQFKNNSAIQRGGAIVIYQTDLTDQVPLNLEISQSMFNKSEFSIQGNEANDGGFIYISNKLATIKITNLTFQNNKANHFGGMIFIEQLNSLTIQDSIFKNSSAQNGDTIFSIASQSQITLNNTQTLCTSGQEKSPYYISQAALISINSSQFSNCKSQQSSGVFYLDNSNFQDLNSSYLNNSGSVGGVCFSASTNLTFTNSRFTNNVADIAGVLGIQDSSILTLQNCTFHGNEATQSAGAIQVSSSSQIHINDSLFENNYAIEKSVLDIQSSNQNVYSVINNTIIQNNRAKQVGISLINGKMIIENSHFYNNSATDVTQNLLLGFSELIVKNSTFDNPVIQDIQIIDHENTTGSFMFIISQVTLTIISSVLQNGRAKQGGAIYLQSESSLYVRNTSFIDNYSTIYGGAIYAQGFVELNFTENCRFINNQALELGDDMYLTFSDKLAYFQETSISNTKAKTSIYAERVQVQIVNSIISDIQLGRDKLSYGSALSCYNCYSIILKDSYFLNSSSQYGGAVYVEVTDDSKSTQFQKKFTYLVDNCTFTNNSSPIGGAIYIHNPQTMKILDSTFMNNTAFNMSTIISDDIQGSGGALYFTCLSDSLCQINIENDTKFIDNKAYVQGGAIYWDIQEPYIDNTIVYQNNQAGFYGNNIGCYAQKIGVINKNDYFTMTQVQGIKDAQNQRRMLMVQNSRQLMENSNNFTIDGLQSGGNIQVTFIALIDKYGQIVGSDSKSKVRLLVNSTYNTNLSANAYPPILEGTNQFTFGNGVTAVEGVIFTATPGFNYSITLQTDGIDLTKKTNIQYMQSIGRSDLEYQFNINLRECNLGERFTTQGKCTLCQKDISFLLQKQTSPGECEDCPTYKAYCLGGAVFGPKPGYWRKSNVTSAIVQCSYQLACLGMVEPNYIPIGDCAQGYQGVICNDCMVGFSRTGENKCAKCPDYTINIVRLIFIIIALILLIILLIRFTLQGARNKSNITNIFMKILLNHFQLIMMTASFDFEWSEQTLEFFTGNKQVATASTQIFSLDCFLDQRIQIYSNNYVILDEILSYQPNYKDTQVRIFFQKMIMIALLPFILVLFCYIGWYLIKLFVIRRRIMKNQDKSTQIEIYQKYKVKGKIIASIVIVLFLVHPSIIQFMFYDFKCQEIDGENRVMNDMEVLCWGQQHFTYSMVVAIPSIFLWGLGIPFFALIIMFRVKDQLDIQKIREQYGFLYRGYKNKFFFWEVVIMYRKIIIIFIAVFINQYGVIAQALIVLVVLIIFLIINSNNHPYITFVLNDLENLSLITSMTTIYCGIFFIVNKPQQWIDENPEYSKGSLSLSNSLRQLIFAIILISNMLFFVYWSLSMYQEIQAKLRKSLPKIYTFICLCNNKNMYDVEIIKNEIHLEHQHLHEQFVNIQSDLSNLFKHKLQLNKDNISAFQAYFNKNKIMSEAGYKSDYQGLDEQLRQFYNMKQSLQLKTQENQNSLKIQNNHVIKEDFFEIQESSSKYEIISKNQSKSSSLTTKRKTNKKKQLDNSRGSSIIQSLQEKNSSIINNSQSSSDLVKSYGKSSSKKSDVEIVQKFKTQTKNNSKKQSQTQQFQKNEQKSQRKMKIMQNIQNNNFD